MPIIEIPQLAPDPARIPLTLHPILQWKNGDRTNHRDVWASKKVDDLSRHESKHNSDPKQDSKHNPREKTIEAPKHEDGPPAPGTPKK